MNINEAKNLIRDTVRIYLAKNEYGEYIIPFMKQRPIFMVGAPGIGKTAIIEQVAQEFDIPVISFSMTHLTRDNAIGVPVIKRVAFGDYYYDVAEYTVSEVVASVYHMILDSKKKEGILFLDEINCVSESLAPLMLLFLQYKKFGNRQLPEGWVIITAGNPPAYNHAVRKFDLATMDRLKYILVEEDVDVWLAYARKHGVHGAIIAFLRSHKTMFYSVRHGAEEDEYVTARGWEDLSKALFLYEKLQIPVSLAFIRQYATDHVISETFFEFYRVYQRYQEREFGQMILSGRDTLPGMNLSSLGEENRLALISQCLSLIGQNLVKNHVLTGQAERLSALVAHLGLLSRQHGKLDLRMPLNEASAMIQEEIKTGTAGGTLSDDERHILMDTYQTIRLWMEQYTDQRRFDIRELVSMMDGEVAKIRKEQKAIAETLAGDIRNLRAFVNRNWEEEEMTFLQSGLETLQYYKEIIGE